MLWKGAFPLLPLLFWLRFLRLSEPRANTHLNHSTFLPPASLCPPSFHQPLSSSPPLPLCGFVNKDKQTSSNEEGILSICVPVPVFCSVLCFLPLHPLVPRLWRGGGGERGRRQRIRLLPPRFRVVEGRHTWIEILLSLILSGCYEMFV